MKHTSLLLETVILLHIAFNPFVLAQEYQTDANTVALLHMNETSGSTVADSSGNGNYGTATGTTGVDFCF